jgi:hypothetical protein
MVIYHGSNVVVQKPKLIVQNRFLDFGFGFYTTYNEEQAKSFAEKVYKRRKCGKPVVNKYNADESLFADLNVLKFESADESWLDFVSDNRAGTYIGESYDCIYGPVANDDVYQTFAAYTAGLLTKEQTIENLKVKQLYNQLVFASERSLKYLRFAQAYTPEGDKI